MNNFGGILMRYAIPVSGGVLSSHFGHCEQFALIDVDDAAKKIVKKEMVNAPPPQPGLLPVWLAERNVNTVLAGGMGQSAQNIFQQKGIKVVVGVSESDPETAVLKHLDGKLAAGDNTCDH